MNNYNNKEECYDSIIKALLNPINDKIIIHKQVKV